MSNLATIVNNILADSGIDDINVVVTTGSYANPAWITSLAWTKITGAPANIVTGTGTTNTLPKFTGASTIGNSNITDSGSLIQLLSNTQLQGKLYYTYDWLQEKNFGYSSGWKTLAIGSLTSANNFSLAFGVDVSGNPSGSFTGNGNEYFWRNTGSFKTPNAINNGYNQLFEWNSSGGMTFNQAAEFIGTVTVGSPLSIKSTTPYIQWINASSTRLAYIQHNATNLVYNADTGTHIFNQSITLTDNLYVRSSGYPSTYYTSLRSSTGAIGILQLGNNNDNYILVGNTNTGGYLSIRVNVSAESIASGTEALRLNSNATAIFSSSVKSTRYLIASSGTAEVYNIVDADQLYAGSYNLQAGAGSSGYGGSLVMYGHSHATKAGYVIAGISAGSNGKFTVNNGGNGAGTEVFTVDVNGAGIFNSSITAVNGNFSGNVTISKTTPGLILNGLGSGNSGAYINLQGWANTYSNWQIGVANLVGSVGLGFTPSTTVGGTTFTTPVFTLSQTGVAAFSSLAGTGTRMVVADASGVLSTQAVPTGTITGSGTTNYVSKWTSGSAIGNSLIYDNGSGVTVNGTTVGEKFNVNGFIGLQRTNTQYWHIGVDATNSISFTRSGIAERMVLSSDGNLMVGSTDAGNAGSINVSVGVAGTTAGGLQLWASAAQTHYLQFGDGTTGAQPYAGYVGYIHSSDSLIFGTAAATKVTIASTGAATFSSTGSFGNGTLNGAYFIVKGVNGVPATSGTTTQAVLRLSSGTGLYNVLDFGTNESLDYSWIQSTRANSLGTYDYLAIQPNGGNLLVGTNTNSTFKLDVNGTGRFSGNLQVTTTGSTRFTMSGTDNGIVLNDTTAASTARNWGVFTSAAAEGDFVIRVGASQGAAPSSDVLYFTSTGAATFSSRVGVAGAAATYPITVYNASNGTTAAFGGTARGIRIDNDGTFSSGRSTIFGVDSSFYGSYQPMSIEASSLALQAITGGNVLVGTTTNSTYKLDVNGTGRFSGDLLVTSAGSTTITNSGTNPIFDFIRTNNASTPTAQINFKTSQGTIRWQVGTNQAVGAGFEINEGNGTANRFYIAPGGAATFSAGVSAASFSTGGNIEITTTTGGYYIYNSKPAIRYSYFGYSSGYHGILVGATSGNQSLFFNVDVSGNPSGAFSGLGNEAVWRNTGSFITPNAINNGYNTLFSWNSSGQLNIPGATTIGSLTTASLQIGDYTGNPTLTFAAANNGINKINFYDQNTTEGLYIRTDGETHGGTMTFGARWDDDEAKIVFKMYQVSAGASYNQRVGIGTTNPSNILDIATPITNAFFGVNLNYTGTSVAAFQVNNVTGELKIGGNATGYFPTFYSSGSERMRISSIGNFDYGGYNIANASVNATYRQAFWGALSIMWRGAEDAYIDSNHTYSATGTNIASYTSANGIGRLGIAGGTLEWGTYNGSVTAGSEYSLTTRFFIAKSGDATFSSTVKSAQYRIAPSGTAAVYNIVDSDQLYAGSYNLQAGGGSAAYGGSLVMFGHSHATKPGYVVAGISGGSGGKFTVNNNGNGGGTELFIVNESGAASFNSTLDVASTISTSGSIVSTVGGTSEIRLRGGGYGGSYNTSLRSIAGATGVLQFGNNGQNTILIGNTNTGGYLDFRTNCNSESVTSGTISLRLNSNATATFYSSVTATAFFESSDRRLKSNILDLDVNVSSIIAKTYLKNGVEEIGYLAQDVESILPSAISKRDDGYLDLSYRQVHTAKIAYLEKRITELEQQLKNK